MSPFFLPGFALILGLGGLYLSAELLIDGSIGLARRLALSPLVIGLTVVAVGTSAPEMAVSLMASLSGNGGIALGNVVGSNVANIALILGVAALLHPLRPHGRVRRVDLPLLGAVTLAITAAAWRGEVGRATGFILLLVFVGYSWTLCRYGKREEAAAGSEVEVESDSSATPLYRPVLATMAGLAGLVASSKAMVWGGADMAARLGISQVVIGLTITALGTSLPELATSVAAARRRESDLVLGNVIGSNIANSTAVLGAASAVAPIVVPQEVFRRDFIAMVVVTGLLMAMGQRPTISRGFGVACLVFYGIYIYLLCPG